MSVKNKQDEAYCCHNRCISTCCTPAPKRVCTITDSITSSVTILDVLDVDICRRAILSHLPLADILSSERVCRRWRDAMHHYIRGAHRFRTRLHVVAPWHHAAVPPGCRPLPLDEARAPGHARALYKWGRSVEAAPATAESFGMVAELCTNVKELTLYGMPNEDSVKDNLEKLGKLKRLAFRGLCSRTGASEQVTAKNYDLHNVSAKHTCTRKSNRPDSTIGIFLEKDTLEELTIVGMEKLTGSFFEHLLTNLTCLRLQDCPDLDCQLLISALDRLRYLRTLELTRLSSEILQNIPILLAKMDNLECLELCRYDKVEMGDLKAFGQLGSLKHLNLRHNSAVDDGWLEAVAGGSKLVSLDVSYCKGVTLEGLLSVCRACGLTLAELGAARHTLTDEQLETLIRLCPYLSVLNAQECGTLSRSLVPYLARLMRRRRRRGLPVLRLRLYGTPVPKSEMRQRHPRFRPLVLDFSRDSELAESNDAYHDETLGWQYWDTRTSTPFSSTGLPHAMLLP